MSCGARALLDSADSAEASHPLGGGCDIAVFAKPIGDPSVWPPATTHFDDGDAMRLEFASAAFSVGFEIEVFVSKLLAALFGGKFHHLLIRRFLSTITKIVQLSRAQMVRSEASSSEPHASRSPMPFTIPRRSQK
jgi:hypothetical protein